MTDRYESRATTHADNCWSWGPAHYGCAVREIERLQAEVERLRTDGASAVRWAPGSAYWSEVLAELFGPDARKGIDVLDRRRQAALERADKLAEALRELEERVQRDEALLRQALEALEVYAEYDPEGWGVADNAIAALRERLAETANDLTRCPNCGGPADNGHDREVPPSPYWCSKCTES